MRPRARRSYRLDQQNKKMLISTLPPKYFLYHEYCGLFWPLHQANANYLHGAPMVDTGIGRQNFAAQTKLIGHHRIHGENDWRRPAFCLATRNHSRGQPMRRPPYCCCYIGRNAVQLEPGQIRLPRRHGPSVGSAASARGRRDRAASQAPQIFNLPAESIA
ncbi:hypothetical protein [Rhodopseudomonas sp. BAL398]|nr:hypothetical protein [Rhodopseudomonas sp. BAL398]MDF3809326.1 hypothetical protein [Rhodopseudomonas sp. BAL398]WOK16999.1 hypothetical protein RBJ75_23155 [Rhodopseudomonas sp. BAL398]